jgi:hypothetical protein
MLMALHISERLLEDARRAEEDFMGEIHSIVGSWTVAVTIPGAGHGLVDLALLSADGTMLVAFPSPSPAAPGAGHRLEFWTPAFGSWNAREDHGVSMTFIALGVDENGAPIGAHTITATVTLASDGQTWSGPFRIDITGSDGTAKGAAEGTVSATRIAARG